MSHSTDTLLPGTILHGKNYDYEIIDILGQGSFGIAYLASVKGQKRGYVAIKEFFMRDINDRNNSQVTNSKQNGIYDKYKQKFIKEAQNLAKLNHEHIIKVDESFEANNTVYYVMEYLNEGSLDEYIVKRGGLSERETLTFAHQIAMALSFMHSKNMLHLDLKPGNIMLKNGKAVLIDFGLSKQYDENGNPETSTTVGKGTKGYAPTEQADYQEGHKNGLPVTMDIYALGGTMFKMLTGQRPPDASELLNKGFPRIELQKQEVSEATVKLIEQAMAPLYNNRIATAEEIQAKIEKIAKIQEITVVETGSVITEIPINNLNQEKTKREQGTTINPEEKPTWMSLDSSSSPKLKYVPISTQTLPFNDIPEKVLAVSLWSFFIGLFPLSEIFWGEEDDKETNFLVFLLFIGIALLSFGVGQLLKNIQKKKKLKILENIEYIQDDMDANYGYPFIMKNNLYGVFHTHTKKIILPPIYDSIYCNIEGYNLHFILKKDNHYGIYRKDNLCIYQLPSEYDFIHDTKDGYLILKKDNHYGICNNQYFSVLLPPEYDSIHDTKDGYLILGKDNHYGIYDKRNNKIIFSPTYDSIRWVIPSKVVAGTLNGKERFFDINGNELSNVPDSYREQR